MEHYSKGVEPKRSETERKERKERERNEKKGKKKEKETKADHLTLPYATDRNVTIQHGPDIYNYSRETGPVEAALASLGPVCIVRRQALFSVGQPDRILS